MRPYTALVLAVLSLQWLPIPSEPTFSETAHIHSETREHDFAAPIDALSVEMPGDNIDLQVSGLTSEGWTEWEELEIENESDPILRESNLVMFPSGVTKVRMKGMTLDYQLHPLRVSKEPTRYRIASTNITSRPRILSRNDWGADSSLLFAGTSSTRSDAPTSDNDTGRGDPAPTVSTRVRECEEAQERYGSEFRTAHTVKSDSQGRRYRWPLSYSPSVRLLVVHHTALETNGDQRPAAERMRAMYQYHANSRGWGDIGYHYVVDEDGQIYQGREGGDYVVGGHVYCNNVGTVGVALMGNFDREKPSQTQMQSLQWLLDVLSKQYDIDLGRNVIFHGKTRPPIVGHKDLISTDCPGYYVFGSLDQVRSNTKNGNLLASINFPPPRSSGSSSRKPSQSPSRPAEGLFALGATQLTGRPGGEVTIALQYRNGSKARQRRTSLATILRSNPRIGIWEVRGDSLLRVREKLLAPTFIGMNETTTMRLKIRFPRDKGSSTLRIGSITYTLATEGKRLKTPGGGSYETYTPPPPVERPTLSSSSSSHSTATSLTLPIRIRLTRSEVASGTLLVTTSSIARLNNMPVTDGMIYLRKDGENCTALERAKVVATGVVSINPGRNISTISSTRGEKRYRGIIECRVVNGSLALINELSLEDYLAGLAEEPDTELHEKQRAFAVAARTYAAYYMHPSHRKFPGLPYDGSDDPAVFQVYDGVGFEERNPRWARAVRSTNSKVLMKDGSIIRAPYFSTDDGRTRSPEEAGWNSFPYSEVFVSKPDPWCEGQTLRGHGVGMSGCGAKGQASEGKTAEEILQYYYPGTQLSSLPALD